jgi:DNA-binding MarR family transcriptional regulator
LIVKRKQEILSLEGWGTRPPVIFAKGTLPPVPGSPAGVRGYPSRPFLIEGGHHAHREPKPLKDSLVEELFYLVRAEQEDVQAFDEQAAQLLGINLTDLRVLGILDRRGPTTASELAEEAGLTSGSTTTLVDRLERAGYAERRRDADDRRRVFVELTDEARTRMGAIWGPLGAEAGEFVQGYSKAELELLVDYLKRGRELLRRHRARLAEMDPSDLPPAPAEG